MRPRKNRIIKGLPKYVKFKPNGVKARDLETIILLVEEYEALRLADYENMTHEDASKLMEVSRQTFSRIVDSARKKMTKMIMEGKALSIEGGNYHFSNKEKNIL